MKSSSNILKKTYIKKTNNIFYLHIPKTGGQTLATRIASAFPIGRSSIIGNDLSNASGHEVLRSLFENNEFVERHVNDSVLKDFSNLDIILTVREPVSQIISNYLHIRRDPYNYLYRAANLLRPEIFFTKFGDLLTNHQCRYLVSAFFDLKIDPERLRSWSKLIFEGLDRIRWVVPTERIDNFTMLWAIETKRQPTQPKATINVALKDDSYGEIKNIVSAMPHLYSLDLLLWQVVNERYEAWSSSVLNIINPFRGQDDWSQAWKKDGSGVWLQHGWHAPQILPSGPSWWAGSMGERWSEVAFRRTQAQRYLSFSVIVNLGVPRELIEVVGQDKKTKLPIFRQPIDKNRWDFWVDIGEELIESQVYIYVAEVSSPIMFDAVSEDADRKSVATCNWSIEEILPVEAVMTSNK